MFEQTSRLAQKLATSVSRRGFLGALGGWAAAAALDLAGFLADAGAARADSGTRKVHKVRRISPSHYLVTKTLS